MTIEEVTSVEAVPQVSPGIRLSAERKKRGLAEREVADQLKITLSKLQSIEKDEFDNFPAQIYLKGYLKNYARLLNISEQEVIDSYEAHAGHSAVEENFAPSPDNVSEPSSGKGMFVLLAVALIAILAFVFYSQTMVSKESPSADAAALFEPPATEEAYEPAVDQPQMPVEVIPAIVEQNEAEAPVDVVEDEDNLYVAEAQESESLEVVNEPVEMLASKLTAVELINLSAPEVEEQAPVLEVVNLNDVLAFRFDNQCWIEVRDSTGSLLYSGLENAGSARQIEGEGPFQIVIGNVEGTALSLNGEGVSLQAPVDGRPLRLQVGS